MKKELIRNSIAIGLAFNLFSFIALAQDDFVPDNPENVNPVESGEPEGCVGAGCGTSIEECPTEGQGVVEWMTPGSAVVWHSIFPSSINFYSNDTIRSLHLTAETPGWYSIYRIPRSTIADSGSHQRNESTFISVPNGYNPMGRPHETSLTDDNSCHGFAILKDLDNDGLIPPNDAPINFAGTFYLTPGHNWAMLGHFCKLKNMLRDRPGACEGIEDTGVNNDPDHPGFGESTLCYAEPGNGNTSSHSVGFNVTGLCAIRSDLPPPVEEEIPGPEMEDYFRLCTIGPQWVGTSQPESEVAALISTRGAELFSTNEISHFDVNNWTATNQPIPGQWSNGATNYFNDGNIPNTIRRHFGATWGSPDATHVHYLPNNQEEDYFNLRWKNYIYTGVFRFKSGDENEFRADQVPAQDSYGPTFYSEWPYMTRAYAFRSIDGGPMQLSGINIREDMVRGWEPGTNSDDPANLMTDVTPLAGQWYGFKIDVRTTPSGVYARAKVWHSRVYGQQIPLEELGGEEVTWEEIEAEAPAQYQAHMRNIHGTRHGMGTIGFEYDGPGSALAIDFLRVVPTTAEFDYNPFTWNGDDW